MIRRTPLNGQHHILFGLLVRLFLGAGLHLLDDHGCLMLDFLFHNLQQIILRLLRSQTGNPLQFLHSLLV